MDSLSGAGLVERGRARASSRPRGARRRVQGPRRKVSERSHATGGDGKRGLWRWLKSLQGTQPDLSCSLSIVALAYCPFGQAREN